MIELTQHGIVVLSISHVRDRGEGKSDTLYNCQCVCGRVIVWTTSQIKRNKSCGCLKSALAVVQMTTHGQSKSRTYKIWLAMRRRCCDLHSPDYKNYGARGIRVCDRWNSFKNFFVDVGEAPKGLTLERKNNGGNYEPSNVCWTTRTEQARNKRNNRMLTHDGRTQCLAAWAEELGKPYHYIINRLKRGGEIFV